MMAVTLNQRLSWSFLLSLVKLASKEKEEELWFEIANMFSRTIEAFKRIGCLV
jgi:hypothetical protein